jgi:hypothetical protein
MRTTQIRGEAYSPCCNTQPFIPICLHRRKHRLCTKDHRAPVLAVAATTSPTSFCGSPRWPPRGSTTHTPCCVATYSLVCHCCPPLPPAILPRPRPVSCTSSQCHHCGHRHCAYRVIWWPNRPPDCACHRWRGQNCRGMAKAYGFPWIWLVSWWGSKPPSCQVWVMLARRA